MGADSRRLQACGSSPSHFFPSWSRLTRAPQQHSMGTGGASSTTAHQWGEPSPTAYLRPPGLHSKGTPQREHGPVRT